MEILLFACLLTLLLLNSFILCLPICESLMDIWTRIFRIRKPAENQHLSWKLPCLKHRIGTTETSSLMSEQLPDSQLLWCETAIVGLPNLINLLLICIHSVRYVPLENPEKYKVCVLNCYIYLWAWGSNTECWPSYTNALPLSHKCLAQKPVFKMRLFVMTFWKNMKVMNGSDNPVLGKTCRVEKKVYLLLASVL